MTRLGESGVTDCGMPWEVVQMDRLSILAGELADAAKGAEAAMRIRAEWSRLEHHYFEPRGVVSRAQMRRKRENLRRSWPELAALLDEGTEAKRRDAEE